MLVLPVKIEIIFETNSRNSLAFSATRSLLFASFLRHRILERALTRVMSTAKRTPTTFWLVAFFNRAQSFQFLKQQNR